MKSRLVCAKSNICTWETWPTLYEAVASVRPLKFLLAGCFCERSLLVHSCNGCGAVECFYMERLEYFRFYYLDLCWMQCSLLHGVGKEEGVHSEHKSSKGLETMGLMYFIWSDKCPLGCVGFNLVFPLSWSFSLSSTDDSAPSPFWCVMYLWGCQNLDWKKTQ